MLLEIRCDEFKEGKTVRKPIVFNRGLNTVLGGELADNSVGKSTFLMILDFVFGGEDYLKKSKDVQTEVGEHTIEFKFLFGNTEYCFSRSTIHSYEVSICDQNYRSIRALPLIEYQKFLFEKYQIDLPYISFRDVISRYIRVYGRENLDEKRPLQAAKREPESNALDSLLKLLNKYADIVALKKEEKEASNRVSALSKAHKYSFIMGATKASDIKENEKQIAELESKLNAFVQGNNEATQLLGLDAETAELIAGLKQKASMLKQQRGKLLSQLSRIVSNIEAEILFTEDDLDGLQRFFPDANIKAISEVEAFHKKLKGILESEYQEAKNTVESQIRYIDGEIANFEKEIAKTGVSTKLPKASFDTYAEISKRIENLRVENAYKNRLGSLVSEKKEASERLAEISESSLESLQETINSQMDTINDFVCNGKKIPPKLSVSETGKTYRFETPLDTGTGTSFKGMVVFDLCIASLTPLPFLVHDSYMLKHIGDVPLANILELYQQLGKQGFIAADKKSSYPESAQKILEESTVLTLSDNGGALFGRTWNIKGLIR